MTTGTRSQTAAAGASTPASPRHSYAGKLGAAARKAAPFNPAVHCGAKARQGVGPLCRQPKGFGTDHPGTGRCKWHGGRSPSGRRHAANEQAEKAIAKLGLPAGSGSPLQLLEKAVRYAEGNLDATSRLLIEQVEASLAAEKPDTALLQAAHQLLVGAIRTAARVGKEAADAHIAERRAQIDETIVGLLERVLIAALDEIGASSDQRTRALARVHRELTAVVPAGDELS